MNSDRYLFRRNLIEFLYQTRPELTRRLKDTPQLFKGQENPFHMEDSVWTHTMMVLQASLDDPDSQIPDRLCALVHDFGKPFTASVKTRQDGKKHISFHGHGARGTQEAVDFLLELNASRQTMQPEEIAGIAFCVSNHIEFYGLTTASDALLFCNRDPVLLTRMIRLFEYDVDGSIMDCGIPSYESNRKLIADCHELLRTAETPRQEELPGKRIHLLCGLPRDEKKAFAGKIPDSYTVSLDSLCGIEEESQLPELEDQPEIRQQAIRELQLESVHSVLLLSGYFLTRHSRRHICGKGYSKDADHRRYDRNDQTVQEIPTDIKLCKDCNVPVKDPRVRESQSAGRLLKGVKQNPKNGIQRDCQYKRYQQITQHLHEY